MHIQSADCVIAIGTKFSWHSTNEWAVTPSKNLIRVDLDVEELQHNFPAVVGIHSDAKPALAGMADRIEAAGHKPPAELGRSVAELKENVREELRKHRPLTAALMDQIEANSPREKIVATDATIPAYWGGNQYLPVYAERGFVTPRLAAIGPGYPMALGAQAAFPDRPVICLAGDGGFMFHVGELATAVQEKLNVVLLIFNNRSYGVLKKLQMSMMAGRIFAVDLHTPEFVKVAEGMGMAGEVAATPDELGAAVRRGFAAKAPYLIDVQAPFEL
ncbi:thiamine pyrophosphate-binding protein [Candidatus Sumerlaeota bacterium]|nr:thiamine pyrophosphate-binding protein [Candidatus Sumerlaeota bacterium]